jgi:hypothetical protein
LTYLCTSRLAIDYARATLWVKLLISLAFHS